MLYPTKTTISLFDHETNPNKLSDIDLGKKKLKLIGDLKLLFHYYIAALEAFILGLCAEIILTASFKIRRIRKMLNKKQPTKRASSKGILSVLLLTGLFISSNGNMKREPTPATLCNDLSKELIQVLIRGGQRRGEVFPPYTKTFCSPLWRFSKFVSPSGDPIRVHLWS